MPSNHNETQATRSYALLYSPPHMRNRNADSKNTKSSSNQNTSKNMNNNRKTNNNNAEDLGIEEQFSKLSIPPKKYKNHDFGISTYFDYKFKGSQAEYKKRLENSTTLYVGNLNLNTTQSGVQKLFSKAGTIKTIRMGIDKKTSGPGGFCFIEYETRAAAEKCKNKKDIFLDGNKVCVDWDAGFSEGRQYTRRRIPRPAGGHPPTQKVNSRVKHYVMKQENHHRSA